MNSNVINDLVNILVKKFNIPKESLYDNGYLNSFGIVVCAFLYMGVANIVIDKLKNGGI